MIASGSADYSDTEQHPETHPDDGSTTPEEQLDIGLIVAGVFITILGFVLLGKSFFNLVLILGGITYNSVPL